MNKRGLQQKRQKTTQTSSRSLFSSDFGSQPGPYGRGDPRSHFFEVFGALGRLGAKVVPRSPPRAPGTTPDLHFWRFLADFWQIFARCSVILRQRKGRRTEEGNQKKISIPFCFESIFGEKIRGTVQKKGTVRNPRGSPCPQKMKENCAESMW